IHGSTRFDVPGERQHWYTRVGEDVHAFDLSSSEEPRFAALGGGGADNVRRVQTPDGAALAFRVDRGALVIDARGVDRHPFGTRYVVELGARERVTVSERRPGGAARAGRRYDTITEALV